MKIATLSPMAWILPLLCVTAAGCGAKVQLERAAAAPRFKALPAKTTVHVVDSPDVLAQPTLVLGVLRVDSPKGEPDRPQVQAAMVKEAAHFGCDAVVGLSVRDEVVVTSKAVQKTGGGGKPVRAQQDVASHLYHWQAQCVRTGLQPADPTGKNQALPVRPVSHAAPAAAPVADPEPTTAEGRSAKLIAGMLLERKPFVRSFADKLQRNAPEPGDVVDALLELTVQVTGPTGLWRKTLPQEWYGCRANPDTPQCKRLDGLVAALKRADALSDEVGRLSRGQSGDWLRRSEARVADYLGTYVPLQGNLGALQATPFYREHLAEVAP